MASLLPMSFSLPSQTHPMLYSESCRCPQITPIQKLLIHAYHSFLSPPFSLVLSTSSTIIFLKTSITFQCISCIRSSSISLFHLDSMTVISPCSKIPNPSFFFSFGYVHIITRVTNEFSFSMATFGLPECYKRKLMQGNLNQLHVGIQHCQVIPIFFCRQSTFYSLQLLSETSTVLKPVSSAGAFTFYSRGRDKETTSVL